MADNLIAKLMIDSTGGNNGGDQGSGEPGFMERLFKVGNEIRKNGLKGMRTSLGINLGIGAILKQSQIFTGLFGTLFQILGALADVLLMPLVPFFLPLIKLLAKAIPLVQRYSQNIVDGVVGIFSFIGDMFKSVAGFFGLSGGETFDKLLGNVGKGLVMLLTTYGLLKITGIWSLAKVFFKTELGQKLVQKYLSPLLSNILKYVTQGFPNFIKGIPAMIIKGTKGLVQGAVKTVVEVVKFLGQTISKLIPQTLKNFGARVVSTLGSVIKFIMKPFSGLITKIALGLSKIPGLGGLGKGLLGKAATGAKFIPGLGAIVTAGFGVRDTIQAFQEGGLKSGLLEGAGAAVKTAGALGGLPTALLTSVVTDAVVNNLQTKIVIEPGIDAQAKVIQERNNMEQTLNMYDMQESTP
tara:strand:+ start:2393 stop:3622 length:1230 start_codon:yes stop_codon:yes gene_type:complete